jgi:VWFA-related protein
MRRAALVLLLFVLLLVLLVVLPMGTPAGAQVHETMTVEVIEVPVYVTVNGKPLRNLPRDAFQLRVNGKPQPVEYFDSIDFAAAAPAAPAAAPQPGVPAPVESAAAVPTASRRARRLYLLLFDLYYTTPEHLERTLRAAEKLVDRNRNETDLYAVATYSRRDGVRFVTSFIRDRDVLHYSIRHLRPPEDSNALALGMVARDHLLETSEIGLDPELASMIEGGTAMKDIRLEYQRERAKAQFVSLQQAAQRMAAMEGQKHVILFSGGWDPKILTLPADLNPLSYNEDPAMRGGIEKMADAFKAAGVMLHGIYIKPIQVSGTTSQRVIVANDDPLHRMVDPTGGEFVHHTNDLALAVEDLVDAQEHVYILGFQRRTNGNGSIDVRVNGLPRGAHVTFRPGFGAPVKKGPVDALQLADIMLNDVPQNGLTVKAGVTVSETATEIAVAFNRAEVVPQLAGKENALDLFIYLFDSKGAVISVVSRRVEFDEKARVPTGWVTLHETFPIPPGTYTAKALVRIAGTNILGFSRSDFTSGESR